MSFLSSWFILAILAGLASNAFNFFSRYFLKEKDDDPTVYAWYFELLRFIAFAAIAVIDFRIIINFRSIILFILLGLTEWIAAYWLMKMHQYSHLSISTILSRTRLLWVPIIGFFVIGESLKVSEYLGIGVLFLGLSVIVAPKKIFVDKGIKYANLDAFMIALNVVITKMALPFGSNSIVNAIMVGPSVLLFPIFMKDARKRITAMFRKNVIFKSVVIAINILSVYLFTQAIRLGDVSKVTAIYQGTMIVAILAGIIFLKEREDIAKKLIGATVTIVGVVLLSLS